MVGGVVEDLRSLFRKGNYEGVVSRADQLLHRQRGKETSTDRFIIYGARAAALIHLGRAHEAKTDLSELDNIENTDPVFQTLAPFLQYTTAYVSWATNDGVAEALTNLQENCAEAGKFWTCLKAQLLYRVGRYDEASLLYSAIFKETNGTLKKQSEEPTSHSTLRLWNLASRRSSDNTQNVTLSKADVEALEQNRRELATNLMASLVLAGQPHEAIACKSGLGDHYELEYNAGCAAIEAKDIVTAENAMEEAERLFRADVDEEEDDLDRGLAPILVQRAYLDQVSGRIAKAQEQYAKILRDRCADPASLAVAANNAAVAIGQVSLGRQQLMFQERTLQKSRHADTEAGSNNQADMKSISGNPERASQTVVFDALKKMKATSGRDVERKLTYRQRCAMARNRAILLLQIGRLDASQLEIDKLKVEFPLDPLVPLIEASVVARRRGLGEADTLLRKLKDCDSNIARAARIALASSFDSAEMAAQLLADLFPGKAAAIATAATILERAGNLEGAIDVLERTATQYSHLTVSAKRLHGQMLLRAGKYEAAAKMLQEVSALAPGDELVHGQLAFAMSYIDADEAERMCDQLPNMFVEAGAVDTDALEARPPPKKRSGAVRGGDQKVQVGKGEVSRDTNEVGIPSSGVEIHAKKSKKKKRKKLLPKNYDPSGPPPDPERWLPKTLRSSYKKKKRHRGNDMAFRGAQGADAAAAEVAAAKNAERSAARIAEAAAESVSHSNVPKGTKNKKKTRRR